MFFKKSKLILDCFTTNSVVHKTTPIDKASSFYPKWLKEIPSKFLVDELDTPTAKKCPGIIEFFKYGITIPLWTDIVIQVLTENKAVKWKTADDTIIVPHNEKQRGSFLNNYTHLKIISPWFFRTRDEVNFHFNLSFWNNEHEVSLLGCPGLTEFKYNHSTNINFFLEHKKEINKIELNRFDPIAILHPLDDRELDIRCHLVDEFELSKLVPSVVKGSFVNGYYKSKKVLNDKKI